MAIIDELAKEKSIKKSKVSATIAEELKVKADELCKQYGVPLDEYLGKIIENSEIVKQHKKFLDDSKKDENNHTQHTHS